MADFMEAMEFRHACKRFNDAKIPEAEFDKVLEIGRLSPSSFGMEPWRFIVVTDPQWQAKIRPLCWDQPQITQCSHLLIIAADNAAVLPGNDYIQRMFERRGDPAVVEHYLGVYANHMAPQFHSKEAVEAWTHKQCYIAAANMMTGAAAQRIDSCPIEGFEKQKLEAMLLSDADHSIALLIAFGYRLNAPKPRARLSMDQLVKRL